MTEVLDTGTYIDNVGPLATDPTILNAIADRVTALVSDVDVDRPGDERIRRACRFSLGSSACDHDIYGQASPCIAVESIDGG